MEDLIIAIFFVVVFMCHMYWGVFSSYDFKSVDAAFVYTMVTLLWGGAAGFFCYKCKI